MAGQQRAAPRGTAQLVSVAGLRWELSRALRKKPGLSGSQPAGAPARHDEQTLRAERGARTAGVGRGPPQVL